jgi:hypothetical protein
MIPVFVLFVLVAACHAQSNCDTGQNTASIYNTACTNPLLPYCVTTYNGDRCSACSPYKTGPQTQCDCPANQWCDNRTSSTTLGTCVPFLALGNSCQVSAACPIWANNLVVATMPCVQGKCAPCAQSRDGNTTFACGGGWPQPGSSRPGETRQCGTDGLWVSTGSIQLAGTTAPAGPTPRGSSNGSSGSAVVFHVALLTVVFLGLA